jgi:hypothetical protein
MKKLTKICLLLAAATTWGSDPQVKAQGTFQATHGPGTAFDEIITTDGYVVMTGDPFFLMKMDQDGSVLWHKNYSSSSGGMTGSSVYQTSDGGFIIGGTLNAGGPTSKATLVKTDSDGNFQWSKTYGGSMYEEIHDAKQSLDGGYIALGYTRSFGQLIDVYLIKTDSGGNLQWSKNFGSNGFDYGNSILQSPDSGYVICGSISLSGPGNDVLLTKVDKSGNIAWIKSYGDTYSDEGRAIIPTLDGGYAIVGYTESFGSGGADVLLVKTSSNGSLQWNIVYGGTKYEYGRAIKQLADGSFVVGGASESFGAGMYDFYLTKFDANQIFTWTKTFGGTSYDWGYAVEETPDNGFIIAGSTPSFGPGDIYVVKTDASGYSGCNEFTPNMSMTLASVTVTNPSVVVSTPATVVNSISFTASNVSTATTLCSLVSVPEIHDNQFVMDEMRLIGVYDILGREIRQVYPDNIYIYQYVDKSGRSFFRKQMIVR